MMLSVNDTAALLHVPAKTLHRWIAQNAIPFHRVDDQIRFNRAELLEWATARRIPVSPGMFTESGADPDSSPTLADALRAGGVLNGVAGHDAPSVLRAIVDALRLPEDTDRDFLYQVLLARESLGSTGIGDGIAIPHVRNPVVLHVSQPSVTLCFLENPIDFQAIDGKPVSILFTLISPTVKTHLHLLSRLSFVLHNPAFRATLTRQPPAADLTAALDAAESAALGKSP